MTLRIVPEPPPAKIPSSCKVCHDPLHRSDMEQWLALCEKTGKDPMDAARSAEPGILCAKCVWQTLLEMEEDGDPDATEIVRKAASTLRRDELGLRAVETSGETAAAESPPAAKDSSLADRALGESAALLPPPSLAICSAGHRSARSCDGLCRRKRRAKLRRTTWR